MEQEPGSCFDHQCSAWCCSRCMTACFTSPSSSCRALLEAAQGTPVLQQSNKHWRDEAFALHGQRTANLSRSSSNLPTSNAAGPGVSAMQCFQACYMAQPPSHQRVLAVPACQDMWPLAVMSARCSLLELFSIDVLVSICRPLLEFCQARLLARLVHAVIRKSYAAQPSCNPLGRACSAVYLQSKAAQPRLLQCSVRALLQFLLCCIPT